MNASSHEKPNAFGYIAAPITANTAPTTIRMAGALRHPDKSSGGGNGLLSLGELMDFWCSTGLWLSLTSWCHHRPEACASSTYGNLFFTV